MKKIILFYVVLSESLTVNHSSTHNNVPYLLALLILCQFGGRLNIYLTSNQEESSNKLLSSFTLIVALAVRIGSNLLSKLVNLIDSFDRALFQFGIMVFIPIVILLNHKSTREYFARKHPRLTKLIHINPATNPEVIQIPNHELSFEFLEGSVNANTMGCELSIGMNRKKII